MELYWHCKWDGYNDGVNSIKRGKKIKKLQTVDTKLLNVVVTYISEGKTYTLEELFKLCGGSLEDIDERIKLKDSFIVSNFVSHLIKYEDWMRYNLIDYHILIKHKYGYDDYNEEEQKLAYLLVNMAKIMKKYDLN